MIDILLAGVGGQGTVLAAKVLAQAAQNKGWQVRTAETLSLIHISSRTVRNTKGPAAVTAAP